MGEPVVQVFITRLDKDLPLPGYAHDGDAGIDLLSAEDVSVKPGERTLVRTGISVAIPEGFAGYVQPRSGRAMSEGLSMVNTPGLIDSGYRGEVKVAAINHDPENAIDIRRGEKIAQLVVIAVPGVALVEVDELPVSKRGAGGFGSTGR